MLLFKDIKQNYPVYILNKDDMTVTPGKVVTVSFPRFDSMKVMSQTPGQMVIDFEIEANGKTATYAIPESLSVTYAGSLVLATEKEGLVREIEAMKNSAEQVLASVDKQKGIVEKATALLVDLNPQFKEKKEYDERLSKMENSIGEMRDILNNFIKELKN